MLGSVPPEYQVPTLLYLLPTTISLLFEAKSLHKNKRKIYLVLQTKPVWYG
jgi:hypothetical protein